MTPNEIKNKLYSLEKKLKCATCSQQFFETVSDFPNVGKQNILYIDKTDGNIYIWTASAYESVTEGSLPGTLDKATQSEVDAGINDTKYVTPSKLANSSQWDTKEDSLGFVPENSANKGVNNGYAPLDGGGKVPIANLPTSVLQYIGVWNAATNTPTLTNPDLTKKGNVYNVSVGGTRFSITWTPGDLLIYNDSGVPEKSGNSNDVISVNGQTGPVVLTQDDVSDGTTYKQYSQTEKTKLAGIESGAEVNNISDVDAIDLTDGGNTNLHIHDNRYYTESEVDTLLSSKQNTLVSGTNIKTVNGISILGSGDIDLIDDAIVDGESKAPTQNAVYDALALRDYLVTTGTVISFDRPYVYNTPTSAGTGNITDNLIGAKIGIVQKIYHNSGSAPTFPAGWIRWGTGTYTTSVLNEIFCEWISGTRVHYWIRQQA